MCRLTPHSPVCLLSLLLCAPCAHAQLSSGKIRLAHNTRRDLLLTYAVGLELTAKPGSGPRRSLVRQESVWVGFVVGSRHGGQVECIQMLATEPPSTIGEAGVAPELARPGVQLRVQSWSRRRCDWTAPDMIAELGPALEALWAWTDWPVRHMEVGRSWETADPDSESSPERRFTLAQADVLSDPPTATVDFQTTWVERGHPQGRGRIVWDLRADLLLRAEGTAELGARGHLRLTVTRESWDIVKGRRGTELREGFTEAMRIASAYQRGRFKLADELARAFTAKRPQSPWRKLPESIIGSTDERIQPGGALDEDKLIDALSGLVIAWQETASEHPTMRADEVPELARLGGEFRTLLEANRPSLVRMTSDDDADRQAMAAFSFGFADDAGSLMLLYELTERSDSRVRAWATNGLTVRGDPQTDARLLASLLEDESEMVRARACQAVEACLRGNRAVRDRVRRLLFDRLEDDSTQVRFQAAAAMESFAEKPDLARVRRIAEIEENPMIRDRLERLVARLEASSR